jgi:hypothetical protein
MKRSKIDLQNFPPDLIYLVCETLCHHCPHANTDQYWASEYQWACQPEEKPNRQTLLNLSLLCKSWGCVAQKFLYHHFGILETTLIAEILFCRTISQNPDLAKLVKFARLRNIDTADNASPIEDWIMEPLNKFSEFLDFPGTIFDPEASNWESFVAPLILLQVPNLKHLFVGHKNDYMLFDKFDKPALVRQQALPPYINAVLVGHDNKHPKTVQEIPGPVDFSTEHLGGIFPAFKHLKRLAICYPDINTVRDPLQLQHVTHLDCKCIALRKQQLRNLISATAALERFMYSGLRIIGKAFATGQDICELLAPHKDTLRILVILTYYAGDSFISIRRLENLRWLEITVEGFWDPIDVPSLDEQALVAALPPSLQFVELRVEEHNWKGIIDAIITYLLSAGKQHTLRSCQIVLTSGVMPIVWDEENTLQFRSSLRAIDQRLEEMSDSITDRPKTGKLRTRIYGPSPIPSGSGIPF